MKVSQSHRTDSKNHYFEHEFICKALNSAMLTLLSATRLHTKLSANAAYSLEVKPALTENATCTQNF